MKKKLQLNDLKVKSFVTAIENSSEIKGASNLIGACIGVSAVDCPSEGALSPCLTGYYQTVPVLSCIDRETGTLH